MAIRNSSRNISGVEMKYRRHQQCHGINGVISNGNQCQCVNGLQYQCVMSMALAASVNVAKWRINVASSMSSAGRNEIWRRRKLHHQYPENINGNVSVMILMKIMSSIM
jgi:hypothetical protein